MENHVEDSADLLAAGMTRRTFITWVTVLGATAITTSSTGCSRAEESADARLKVYTSFYAMYDLTQKVGGDLIDVHVLVPNGTEPHEWEPSTTDIAELEDADMLILNGAQMETWSDSLISSLANDKLTVVVASDGIPLLDSSEADEGQTYDPHVWLAPRNAQQEMANITTALSQVDSANAAAYESNRASYDDDFDVLDEAFSTQLATCSKHRIVVAHEAYGYLCSAYGLTEMGIEGLEADAEPDPARMVEIEEYVKQNDVTTIFFEDMVSPKVAETIARDTGAATATINPLEGLTDAQVVARDDYFSVMRDNLSTLMEALA
jgi:zinc transport system substrate-binding protein